MSTVCRGKGEIRVRWPCVGVPLLGKGRSSKPNPSIAATLTTNLKSSAPPRKKSRRSAESNLPHVGEMSVAGGRSLANLLEILSELGGCNAKADGGSVRRNFWRDMLRKLVRNFKGRDALLHVHRPTRRSALPFHLIVQPCRVGLKNTAHFIADLAEADKLLTSFVPFFVIFFVDSRTQSA